MFLFQPAETLFRCSLCPKMFSHEHYLQRHANLVHGGAPIIGQEPAALVSPAGSEPPSAPPATGGNPIEPSTKVSSCLRRNSLECQYGCRNNGRLEVSRTRISYLYNITKVYYFIRQNYL